MEQDISALVLLFSMLEQNGSRALLARSVQEAVEIASRQFVPIDLVLCDVLVARQSGSEVLDRLREVRPKLRALFFSNDVDNGAIRIQIVRQIEPGRFSYTSGQGLLGEVRDALNESQRMSAS